MEIFFLFCWGQLEYKDGNPSRPQIITIIFGLKNWDYFSFRLIFVNIYGSEKLKIKSILKRNIFPLRYLLQKEKYRNYSGSFELGTPKGLSTSVLNSEVVLFLRSISMC